jgi:hypothetical protein
VADLSRYSTLVVAGCDDLTDHQRALVRDFPGRVVEMPDLADPQVRVQTDADFAISIQRVPEGAAVHVIRYDYDEDADAVPALERLELSIRLPETFSRAEAISPAGDLRAALTADGERHRLVLEAVPLYGVVLLRP